MIFNFDLQIIQEIILDFIRLSLTKKPYPDCTGLQNSFLKTVHRAWLKMYTLCIFKEWQCTYLLVNTTIPCNRVTQGTDTLNECSYTKSVSVNMSFVPWYWLLFCTTLVTWQYKNNIGLSSVVTWFNVSRYYVCELCLFT